MGDVPDGGLLEHCTEIGEIRGDFEHFTHRRRAPIAIDSGGHRHVQEVEEVFLGKV